MRLLREPGRSLAFLLWLAGPVEVPSKPPESVVFGYVRITVSLWIGWHAPPARSACFTAGSHAWKQKRSRSYLATRQSWVHKRNTP